MIHCLRHHLVGLLVLTTTVQVASRSAFAEAEGEEITIGSWRQLESNVLGETRRFIVSTPEGYENSDDRYAVLYLLDGEYHFLHTAGLVEFMARNDDMPNMIIVAIANTDRTRDMTPPTRDVGAMLETAGGAENFAAFIHDELMPFVDANFRTAPYRVLVGHSFGGLFAIHALVHHPDLFDATIAISPSLQWDDQLLVDQAETFFHETEELNRALYMTTGNEGGALLGGVLKIVGALEEKAPRGFEWDSRVMKDETHMTVPHRSTRQGLEFIFGDWALREPLLLHDSGGMDAIDAFYQHSSAKYGIERTTPPMTVTRVAVDMLFDGRLEEARAVLEHDPVAYPPSSMIYVMLGEAYAELDDDDEAAACFTRALEINPGDESVRTALIDMGVDAATLPPRVDVAADVLESYVGSYTTAVRGDVITIDLDGDSLYFESPYQPRAAVTSKSQTRFAVPGGMLEISFEPVDDGETMGMTLHIADGRAISCIRTE